MKSLHLVRLGNAALSFGIIISTVAGALLVATTPAGAAPAEPSSTTSSGVSIAWATDHTDSRDPNYETFKNLTLTVSQTKNLVNQGIKIGWAGARPTSTSDYSTNYMQIMQCWGDAATGPTPDQCQWGSPSPSLGNLLGVNTGKRDLVLGGDPVQDPLLDGPDADPDLLLEPPLESPNLKAFRVPFRSVNGKLAKTTNDLSKIFSPTTTNEVTAGRTGLDGTGTVAFETQTSLEAPQLGCGADVKAEDGSASPRSCWLVVVPRGELNLDNTTTGSANADRISGSPLSASAWKNRLAVKLDFQSVSVSCPLGNPERRIVGAENIAEAITSWQPALCGRGTTYGFSLIGDDEARRQIVSTVKGSSRLAVVTKPLDEGLAQDAVIRYAPIAESAIVVAFTIDYRLFAEASGSDKNGLQAQSITLNARLVAKLLTQSYRIDVPGRASSNPVVNANPLSILTDPEFLRLNPEFDGSTTDNSPAGLMVSLGSSDANALVWSWLRADPKAFSFLRGEADEWNMKINPGYLSLGLADDPTTDFFPKADLTVATTGSDDEPGYGTLDMRPYMNDMHEAAYRTLKADPNNKNSWDPFKQPKAYVSLGPQVPGARFILSITDAASAARYGLSTAKLVNGAGDAIAATDASIKKSVALMVDSGLPGVKVVDPAKRAVGAYPLAMLSYAAINVCASTSDELADYTKLIDYAVGDGQRSGDARGSLPRGYVSLETNLAAQAAATSAGISDAAAVATSCPQKATAVPEVPATSTPTAQPTLSPPTEPSSEPTLESSPEPTTESTAEPTPEPSALPTDEADSDSVSPAAAPVAVPPVPVSEPVTSPVPEAPPVVDPEDIAEVQLTQDQPLNSGRVGLAGALALGIPSMIAGPLLSRRGRKLAKLADFVE